MGNYLQANQTLMFHLVTLTASWVLLANVAVWFSLIKHKLWGYYGHVILSFLVAIISLVTTMLYIVPRGLPSQCQITPEVNCDPYQYALAIQGTILLVWIAVQVFSGIWARYYQESPKSKSLGVIRSKSFHRYSGYTILVLGKTNTFIHWRSQPEVWGSLLVIEIISIIIYVKIKWYCDTLQKNIKDPQLEQITEEIKEIKYLEDLNKETSKYVVFADYVYNIDTLITMHPGGYQVIQKTKGRQIDRFMYGMYGAQLVPEVQAYSHPSRSLNLVGLPVAKITIPSSYQNMHDLHNCKVAYIQQVSQQSNIYIVRLASLGDKGFKFKGYSQLAQAGQYFSITIDDITRLYTTVNTLVHANIRLMTDIIPQLRGKVLLRRNLNPIMDSLQAIAAKGSIDNPEKIEEVQNVKKFNQKGMLAGNASHSSRPFNLKVKMEEMDSRTNDESRTNLNQDWVPLMIKRYDGGKLTPILIGDTYREDITISCPRGQGLKLEIQKEGRLVFLAGGTGFYPFMDIIDLLFKQKVLKEKLYTESIRKRILQLNPILKEPILEKYTFLVMVSIATVEDLHPISLYQLNVLCEYRDFKCIFRLTKDRQEFQRKYQNIQLTKEYFNQMALNQAKKEETSKIYICGPPSMNTGVAKLLHDNNIDEKKYQLV